MKGTLMDLRKAGRLLRTTVLGAVADALSGMSFRSEPRRRRGETRPGGRPVVAGPPPGSDGPDAMPWDAQADPIRLEHDRAAPAADAGPGRAAPLEEPSQWRFLTRRGETEGGVDEPVAHGRTTPMVPDDPRKLRI